MIGASIFGMKLVLAASLLFTSAVSIYLNIRLLEISRRYI